MSKPGPQPTEIDWKSVRKLSQMQCTQEEIASFLDISVNTLDRATKREFGDITIGKKIKGWAIGGHCSLRRSQWLLAHKNAAMAIFLGKQYLGQKDTYGMKHTGDMVLEVVNFADDPKQIELQESNG